MTEETPHGFCAAFYKKLDFFVTKNCNVRLI